tara:strand:+ start:977 stop:1639 length:663 start_codon:yes stop_codon:yes gene_type:complete
MDGISKNPFTKLPDVSTNTMVYTVNAPQDVLNINQDVIDYIHMMDGLGAGVHDTINAGVSKFTGWKSFDTPSMQYLLNWIGFEIENNFMGHTVFKPVFTQVWGMKYEVNDVTPAHAHDPAVVSFTYYPYIENPEIAQPLEICTFPDGNIKKDLSMCAEHVQEKEHQWGNVLLSIPPKTGQLVIFPAYVYHQVQRVTVPTGRYCIAGNVSHDFENPTSFNT